MQKVKNKIKKFLEYHADFGINPSEESNINVTNDRPKSFQRQITTTDNSNLPNKEIQKAGTFIDREGHIELPEVSGTQKYPNNNELNDVLSEEDIEDQFLRMKEVFGCDLDIYSSKRHSIVSVLLPLGVQSKDITDIKKLMIKELDQIKNRMEKMYPVELLEFWNDQSPSSREAFGIRIYIRMKP